MHICYITNEYPTKDLPQGGIGTFVKMISHALTEKGHEVSVIGLYDKQEALTSNSPILVSRLQKARGRLAFWKNRQLLNNAIDQLHNNRPIDIIETPELGLAFLKKKKGIRYLIRMHGGHHYFATAEKRPLEWRKVVQERLSFSKADYICACSSYVAETTRNLIGLKNRKITVIYNPLDTKAFKEADIKKTIPNSLLFIGSIVEKKGVRQLVQAMPTIKEVIPQVQLKIVGRAGKIPGTDASYLPILKKEIRDEIKKSIHFIGAVPHKEIPNYIEEAEICVYPSHMEAMPIAWLEALGMGKPFVGSSSGPGPEAVKNEVTGLLCNPHDPLDIASKVLRMLQSKGEAIAMGKNARKDISKRFDLEIIVKQNISYYKSILN